VSVVLAALGDDRLDHGQAAVQRTADGVEVALPAPRQRYMIAFMVWWVASSLWAVARHVDDGPIALIGVPFLGLALGGLAWTLAGRERLTVTPAEVLLWRGVGPVGRTRRCDRARVGNLRAEVPEHVLPLFHGPFLEPTIAFEHGARTHRFGSGIEEAEAKQIVRTLHEQGVGA
jgi:hypothetical protein